MRQWNRKANWIGVVFIIFLIFVGIRDQTGIMAPHTPTKAVFAGQDQNKDGPAGIGQDKVGPARVDQDKTGPAGEEPEKVGPPDENAGSPDSAEDPAAKPGKEREQGPADIPKAQMAEEDIDYRLYLRYARRIETDEKEVYITVDDGPNPLSTPAYLKILSEKGVKATFFVLGSLAERYPELVRAIKEDGHAIGNHTYSHSYRKLYKKPDNYMEEMERTCQILKGIIGEDIRLTRAPGGTMGHFSLDYYRRLEAAGYVTHDWNIDVQDAIYKNITPWRIMKNVMDQTGKKDMVVVLLHDHGKQATIDALPQVIDYYAGRGYKFKIMDMETPVIAHRTPALQSLSRRYRGKV